MPDQNQRLLTIVCESMLEPFLQEELPHLGASGYTVTDARGAGRHGRRGGAWAKESNIKVDIVCDAEVALRVVDHINREYKQHYALVMYSTDATMHCVPAR